MTEAEMHALEKAALDDAFLADAIDGMREAYLTYGASSVNSNLSELNRQLNIRSAEPPSKADSAKIISTQWWKYAAAATVVVALGAVAYNSFFKTESNQELIAQTEKNPVDRAASKRAAEDTIRLSTTDVATAQANSDSQVEDAVASRQKLPAVDQPRPQAARTVSEPPTDEPEIEAATSQAPAELVKKAEAEKEEILVSGYGKKRAEDPGIVRKSEGIAAMRKDSNIPINQFAGLVTDRNNLPLPNATILYNRNQNVLAADQYGNFNFFDKDSVLDVQVQVPGYQEKNFIIQKNNRENKLILEKEIGRLNKLAFSPKSANKSEASNKKTELLIELQHAIPENGWIAYENYLQENKVVPRDSLSGEVIVSFEVNASGTPQNFKIEKSPGPAYEKEAIRLISAGPRWISNKKTSGRTTVSVKF